MAEELAGHGYVVVALDHPECWATELADGRYLEESTTGEMPGRLGDMKFLLDDLARPDTNHTLFAGRLDLDLERVGVSGLSAGGMVVETLP